MPALSQLTLNGGGDLSLRGGQEGHGNRSHRGGGRGLGRGRQVLAASELQYAVDLTCSAKMICNLYRRF